MSFGPANFLPDRHTTRSLTTWAEEIAERIAVRFERRLMEHIGKPPEHIVDAPVPPPNGAGAKVATP
jgi:hypothetical protein